jgi:hypothetical protein
MTATPLTRVVFGRNSTMTSPRREKLNAADSALAQWYQHRFATGGSRQRRIGIVALARKLLIALSRYVDQAIVPEGARLKVTLA